MWVKIHNIYNERFYINIKVHHRLDYDFGSWPAFYDSAIRIWGKKNLTIYNQVLKMLNYTDLEKSKTSKHNLAEHTLAWTHTVSFVLASDILLF